jgi:hypothetical protein
MQRTAGRVEVLEEGFMGEPHPDHDHNFLCGIEYKQRVENNDENNHSFGTCPFVIGLRLNTHNHSFHL